MLEKLIVEKVVEFYRSRGLAVATEVANFNRSADIALIDKNDEIIVVECKVSSVTTAIKQIKTHSLSADKVFIAMPFKKTKEATKVKLEENGVGLIYVYSDGSVKIETEAQNCAIEWKPAKEILYSRILEAQ